MNCFENVPTVATTYILQYDIFQTSHSGMEQLAVREPHKLEVGGSSPPPAITDHSEMSGFLFLTGVN